MLRSECFVTFLTHRLSKFEFGFGKTEWNKGVLKSKHIAKEHGTLLVRQKVKQQVKQ